MISAIPVAACLSARTCQAAEVLRAEKLGGGLALNIAIMHELWLGDESRWAGYFAILPKGGERTLPMFWSDAQLSELDGVGGYTHARFFVSSRLFFFTIQDTSITVQTPPMCMPTSVNDPPPPPCRIEIKINGTKRIAGQEVSAERHRLGGAREG